MSRPPRSLAIVVVTTGAFVYSMLQSLVIPALTTIQRDLHTSATASTWVVSSLLLSTAIATPILGRLGDMFGRSRMLVVSLSSLAAGCVVSALASSIGLLIAGRVLQGLGGAAVALAFSIVRDVARPERVAGGIGFVAAMTAVGAATGIVLSGPIATSLGYRWLFWLPLIVIVPTAIAAALLSQEFPLANLDTDGTLFTVVIYGVSYSDAIARRSFDGATFRAIFAPSTVTKLGQKPLKQLKSLLQADWSITRLRPNSVSSGPIAMQLDCTEQSPQPSHTSGLMKTRRSGSGNCLRLRRRRFSAAQVWT